jgi:hypothetical protein
MSAYHGIKSARTWEWSWSLEESFCLWREVAERRQVH